MNTPEYGDSYNVLKEISTEFGATNTRLDAETLSVVRACWQLLEKAFDEGTVSSEQLRSLHSLKCIPNSDNILYPPEWIFFENRAESSPFSGSGVFLTKNVIHDLSNAGPYLRLAYFRWVRLCCLSCWSVLIRWTTP